MKIIINSKLVKSRNPTEHKIKLENQSGEIIQVVGDGYNLILFKQFKITSKNKSEYLEWYVHDTDFHLYMIVKK